MSGAAAFDFDAMKAQGDAAGVPALYLLIMTPLPVADPQPAMSSALEVHYSYVHRLIEQGKVLAIGPCIGEPAIAGGAPVPPGFGILTVSSREEAEEIAREEPFHTMGWRHNTVMAWTPKFGSLIAVLRDMAGPGE
ncbi:MAG TPA: YciI family protein [Mycobacterium sp.]|nr:YciI family protein [Mycobacterium sp.]HQC76963.1 YciI family protein [Mycobacterium sp.]